MISLSYQARFTNGIQPQPFTVHVSIEQPQTLLIQYTEQGETKQQRWPISQIEIVEHKSSILVLKNSQVFPHQWLEITNTDLIAEFAKSANLRRRRVRKVSPFLAVLLAVSGLIALVLMGYFWLLPRLADYGAKVFPKSYEIELGKQVYQSVLETEKVDSVKSIHIQSFFKQLNIQSEYPIQIAVVKSDVVNAFALPGGSIVVYDAILKKMRTPEQLAALLSHEYSHVALKHATRNIFRTLSGYLFLSLLFGDMNGVAGVLIENGNQLRSLHYSREMEKEADDNGLKILQSQKVNTNGMKALFELLKQESGGAEINELLSTHPDLDLRISNVEVFQKLNQPYTQVHDSLQYYFKQLQ